MLMRRIGIKIMVFAFLFLNYLQADDLYELSLRQHNSDKNLMNKPAIIQYLDPDEGESSYAIHAALKGTIIPENSSWEYGFFVEWHKNTLNSKEQDTRMFGFSMEGSWGDIMKGWMVVPEFSLAYKNDKANNNESSLAIAELNFIYGEIGINKLIGSDQLKFTWSPTLALEDEYVFNAKDNGPTGNIARMYCDVSIAVYPWFKDLDDGRLSLYASYSYWNNLSKDDEFNTIITEDDYNLIKYGLSYRLTPIKVNKNDFSIFLSLDRVKGENPRTNHPDQDYKMISIGLQY